MLILRSRLARCRCCLACACLLLSLAAAAEEISFRLSQEQSRLSVALLGDGAAYYPSVLRMLPDGRWERLAPAPGTVARAELRAGDTLELAWPQTAPAQDADPLARMQPVMVRYFEQLGIGVGQISLFQPPPPATDPLRTGYADGVLTIHAGHQQINPARASWVLWPREDGAAQLLLPFRENQTQPAAQRIDWRSGAMTARIEIGTDQPEVILLHETDHGYVMQTVPRGTPDIHQLPGWVGTSQTFYGLALAALATAVVALLRQVVRSRRRAAP